MLLRVAAAVHVEHDTPGAVGREPLAGEGQPEVSLADPGGAVDAGQRAGQEAAAQHRIELRESGGDALGHGRRFYYRPDGGPRNGPPCPPAFGAPRRSRGAPLSRAAPGGPKWPPMPPSVRSAPAQPWRSSFTRRAQGGPRNGPTSPASGAARGAGALVHSAVSVGLYATGPRRPFTVNCAS